MKTLEEVLEAHAASIFSGYMGGSDVAFSETAVTIACIYEVPEKEVLEQLVDKLDKLKDLK